MTDLQQSLYQLQTWFSPSFLVGAYSYSHGLEAAYEAGQVNDVETAVVWIEDIISHGSGLADATFVAASHRAVEDHDSANLRKTAEFAIAFTNTSELRLESEAQGRAFIDTVQKIEPNSGLDQLIECWPGPYAYIVAVGCAGVTIDRTALVTAYLHAFVANLASALVRIVPLGQTDGQRIIARLSQTVEQSVAKAQSTPLDSLATSTLMVDVMSMRHERQYTRLFRS